MRTNVIGPTRTVFGKCSVRISFQVPIQRLTEANIVLVGNTDGVSYRIFGTGAGWVLQFRLPADTTGQFTISLVGWVTTADGEQITINPRSPVFVDYDTHRAVRAEFGEVIKKKKRTLCFPITLSDAVVGFTKKHVSVGFSSGKGTCRLYGQDRDYELLIQPPRTGGTLTITPAQSVEKVNGIVIPIAFDAVEMDYEGVG